MSLSIPFPALTIPAETIRALQRTFESIAPHLQVAMRDAAIVAELRKKIIDEYAPVAEMIIRQHKEMFQALSPYFAPKREEIESTPATVVTLPKLIEVGSYQIVALSVPRSTPPVEKNFFAIELSRQGEFRRTIPSGNQLRHSFTQNSKRVKILLILHEKRAFVSTEKLMELTGIENVDTLYDAIRVINNILAEKLQLHPDQRLIQGRRYSGYRINPAYNLMMSS